MQQTLRSTSLALSSSRWREQTTGSRAGSSSCFTLLQSLQSALGVRRVCVGDTSPTAPCKESGSVLDSVVDAGHALIAGAVCTMAPPYTAALAAFTVVDKIDIAECNRPFTATERSRLNLRCMRIASGWSSFHLKNWMAVLQSLKAPTAATAGLLPALVQRTKRFGRDRQRGRQLYRIGPGKHNSLCKLHTSQNTPTCVCGKRPTCMMPIAAHTNAQKLSGWDKTLYRPTPNSAHAKVVVRVFASRTQRPLHTKTTCTTPNVRKSAAMPANRSDCPNTTGTPQSTNRQ